MIDRLIDSRHRLKLGWFVALIELLAILRVFVGPNVAHSMRFLGIFDCDLRQTFVAHQEQDNQRA